jgi:hypothetical protein
MHMSRNQENLLTDTDKGKGGGGNTKQKLRKNKINEFVRGGADKSLARPTSRCRRMYSWKTAGFKLNQ